MLEQANAASRSADIAASQSQAVNDSAKAAKDSAAAASTLTEQNKEIIAAARTQAGASKITANSAEQSLQTASPIHDRWKPCVRWRKQHPD